MYELLPGGVPKRGGLGQHPRGMAEVSWNALVRASA